MEISLDTILKTPKLSLRAVDFTDVDLVWEATRFDGFNDGMTWDPPETREDIVRITERNLEHWKQGKDYVFTIELLNPVCAIGRVGLHKESEPDTWNIGFWIHPDHWGNGYAGEASRSVLQFGFEAIGAGKIVTAHAVWNTRSQRVIESLGFHRVQENPAGFYKNGKPVPEYEYELIRAR